MRAILIGKETQSFFLSKRISFFFHLSRNYSQQSKEQKIDISEIGIKNIGTISDFFIPPSYKQTQLRLWHKLFLKKWAVTASNTYNVIRFKRETNLKLKFNEWKEKAIEEFVKTNKVFAAACSKDKKMREEYIRTQLDDVVGIDVIKSLAKRSMTLPENSRLTWSITKIEKTPKIVSFNIIPDNNDISAYLQIIIKLITKQKLIFESFHSEQKKATEKVITDYLVYTLNPFKDEIVLVGSLFESDPNRSFQSTLDHLDSRKIMNFMKTSSDILRSKPT